IGREERRRELTRFNLKIVALESNFAISTPKQVADLEKLICTSITLIMVQKVPITPLLRRRTAGHNIQRDATIDQPGESIDLLHKRGWLHEPRSVRNDELQLLRRLSEGGRNHEGVRLVTTKRHQHRFNSGFFRATRKPQPAFHVG